MNPKDVAKTLALLLFAAACGGGPEAGTNEDALPGHVITDPPSTMEMVYVPAGSFMMGSDNADDEMPVHEVRLDGFYIGKHVVTQHEWTALMGSNPSESVGRNLPVENVSWYDAQSFARRLSEATGRTYRLPTEAEWEYAARAGSTTDYYFGDDTSRVGAYAWYDGNSGRTLHPVGEKKPNAWGLYDVMGNLGEWCQDYWDPGFYARSEYSNPVNNSEFLYTNPTTNETSSYRVVRSGPSWISPEGMDSAHRHAEQPHVARRFTGFRLVRELQAQPTQAKASGALARTAHPKDVPGRSDRRLPPGRPSESAGSHTEAQ